MTEEGPKLYANKPKKVQLKQLQGQHRGKDFTPLSSSSSAAASYTMGPQHVSPPPQPPKESFARRYRFLWPLLLTVNLAVGAYLYMRTKKKDAANVTNEDIVPPAKTEAVIAPSITEKPLSLPSTPELLKLREPIPENEQRELYKWILEEKRKLKPNNPEEKKQVDAEKAILKEFIRAKSIPAL